MSASHILAPVPLTSPLPVSAHVPVQTAGAAAATCPLCHTLVTVSGRWRCTRCAATWDSTRLQTVAAYAQFVQDHASTPVSFTLR